MDYVRFLIGRMWGSVTPGTCRESVNSLNQGTHKRWDGGMVELFPQSCLDGEGGEGEGEMLRDPREKGDE